MAISNSWDGWTSRSKSGGSVSNWGNRVHLANHPRVSEAVVITRETNKSDKYLCAYLRLKDREDAPLGPAVWRDYLSGRVPDYMIPSYFVQLKEIPLTSSGKIDRKALPAPGLEAGTPYAAPRDEIEMRLVEIWSNVLGREEGQGARIGIDDSFFHLGGHSLSAMLMTSTIHKEFQVKISLAEVFKSPTIRGLAKLIEKAEETRYIR